jgi:hypothetical protein
MKEGGLIMRHNAQIMLFLVTVALASMSASGGGVQQRQLTASQLGPDPFFGAPESLGALVKQVPAAVVAEIVGTDELQFEEVAAPRTTKLSVRGYATYRAIIREVAFNKMEQGPPLAVGSEVVFRQHVGREGAAAFTARQIPVDFGDECLLFLWLQPHGWDILNWHLQFKRSLANPTVAEGLGQAGHKTFLSAQWLGSAVPFAMSADEVMPYWTSLVGEVKRLGNQPPQ